MKLPPQTAGIIRGGLGSPKTGMIRGGIRLPIKPVPIKPVPINC